MVDENKRTLLIVEDDRGVLDAYETAFGRKYNVTSVFHPNEDIPLKYYDLAILDGLKGDCIDVAKRIKAGKTIVISGDPNMLKKADEAGLMTGEKPISCNKLEEMLR